MASRRPLKWGVTQESRPAALTDRSPRRAEPSPLMLMMGPLPSAESDLIAPGVRLGKFPVAGGFGWFVSAFEKIAVWTVAVVTPSAGEALRNCVALVPSTLPR